MADHGIHAWGLSQLSLEWLHATFGEGNAVECFFRTFKERLRASTITLTLKAH
jgi:hypothetical protein